jgi:hypothetical protein
MLKGLNLSFAFAAVTELLMAVAGTKCVHGEELESGFPQASVDYFHDMDDSIALTPDQVRGRNTWMIWTGGDQAFWNYLARRSFGTFDLLKVLDSRGHSTRFAYYGLMNEPGFAQATKPDEFGLWLDVRDGTSDPAYSTNYGEAFPKDQFLRTYGRASGVVGLRLFPNPDFDDAARQRWDGQRYYNDPNYFRDPELVPPYRVGMACSFCHVGPHPLHPPADPEKPQWQNLSTNTGNQYFKPGRVFVLPGNESNFLFQVVNAMPPGTIDTSALATDNMNNPRSMNAMYNVGVRLANAAEEKLAGGNLDMPGTSAVMRVPHVLKDGADSIGVLGALARVYVSIGSDHEEWLKHFNLLIGGMRQTPFPIGKEKQASPYFRATLDRLANVADFFVAATKPHPLAQAPGGDRYLQDNPAVARGQDVFAQTCAGCHVSYNKMPRPPPGIEIQSAKWNKWLRSDDFKQKMTVAVRDPNFLQENYLSTDRPIPINRVRTNACAALAGNATRGHIWDNFSSESYKERPKVDPVDILDPFTNIVTHYPLPGGGRGYQRVPSLVSIWASAPYLHNNSVGIFTGDPSVSGRMKAFEDGIEKMLWPEKRLGLDSIYRTTQVSWLYLEKSYLPWLVFQFLKFTGFGMPGRGDVLQIGPIPQGTPVNLVANIDLEPTFDPVKIFGFGKVAIKLHEALRHISENHLDETAAAARMKELGPALLKLSKCPDLVTDHGHLFGTNLSDDDKRALIAYLKRL